MSNHSLIRLKDSSREFRLNCVISFIFYLYLMLHACVQRFDVTGNFEKFWELNTTFEVVTVAEVKE